MLPTARQAEQQRYRLKKPRGRPVRHRIGQEVHAKLGDFSNSAKNPASEPTGVVIPA
jgi:hypothetical protein